MAVKSSAVGMAEAGLPVRLSHPERVLWPAVDRPAITKAGLAQYYASVAHWIAPHIAGRPCSVVRAPGGVQDGSFYQRHPSAGFPPAITRVRLRGERRPYLGFDDAEALAAAAQIAAVELHPWNCLPRDPDTPGRLVFDLDPGPGADFKAVMLAARDVRARLSACGLNSFCRTTGGEGLHVVAPLAADRGNGANWGLAKAFARAICARMAADSPSDYVISPLKRLRRGRVFLDYLRNDRMATAIAPLSPRARSGAPVAMPLNWRQLRDDLDPLRFTVHTARAALIRTKPWTGYAEAAASLAGAAVRLGVDAG